MGQHLASLRIFLKMEGERSLTNTASITQPISSMDLSNFNAEQTPPRLTVEDNGNEESGNDNEPESLRVGEIESKENKPDENLNNEPLDFGLDNHNSRFESIYSQQIDSQDQKPACDNGNFVSQSSDTSQRHQEASCSSTGSSNSSSSSEDSPTNQALRRTSKTLSFGKRRGEKSSSEIES